MTRFALVTLVAAVLSLLLLPWPVSTALALISALFIPTAPLAVGLVADALYFMPGSHLLPLATIAGALATAAALFVRSRLAPGIISS